mmetsp:Transcript_16971/g.28304  ORF Transcript_16971/g.28304 Transcript_16971/m.28304 type:complete len:111 (+) Transcript_16971:188-520(+)
MLKQRKISIAAFYTPFLDQLESLPNRNEGTWQRNTIPYVHLSSKQCCQKVAKGAKHMSKRTHHNYVRSVCLVLRRSSWGFKFSDGFDTFLLLLVPPEDCELLPPFPLFFC